MQQIMSTFDLKRSSNNQYYFVLVATNGEIIAKSEMYVSRQGALNGIESVKQNAPIAKIVDKT